MKICNNITGKQLFWNNFKYLKTSVAWLHFHFVSLHMASAGTGVCRFQQSTNIFKNFWGRNYSTLGIFQEHPKRLNIYAISTLCVWYRTLTRDCNQLHLKYLIPSRKTCQSFIKWVQCMSSKWVGIFGYHFLANYSEIEKTELFH